MVTGAPMKSPSADSGEFLDRLARVLAIVELWLGVILSTLGALFLLMWWTGRATDRHGMFFAYVGGTFVLQLGVMILAAGIALRFRFRGRWLVQLLPWLWPFVYRRLIGF